MNESENPEPLRLGDSLYVGEAAQALRDAFVEAADGIAVPVEIKPGEFSINTSTGRVRANPEAVAAIEPVTDGLLPFYVTFSQSYRRKTHPSGGHPDGWYEVRAVSRAAAWSAAMAYLSPWSALYDATQFKPEHYPLGELGGIVRSWDPREATHFHQSARPPVA